MCSDLSILTEEIKVDILVCQAEKVLSVSLLMRRWQRERLIDSLRSMSQKLNGRYVVCLSSIIIISLLALRVGYTMNLKGTSQARVKIWHDILDKQPMGCEAQHAWKCPYSRPLFRPAILARNVSQTGLVSVSDHGLFSCVHPRVQVSVRSGYDLFHSG